MLINPDHFLRTREGRLWTMWRNARAWEQSFEVLGDGLLMARPNARFYVLIGAQATDKSTWTAALADREPQALICDAILVKRAERAPILAAARLKGTLAVAVWFRTPLATCLARNAACPRDQVVDACGLRNVFAALKSSALVEGFA